MKNKISIITTMVFALVLIFVAFNVNAREDDENKLGVDGDIKIQTIGNQVESSVKVELYGDKDEDLNKEDHESDNEEEMDDESDDEDMDESDDNEMDDENDDEDSEESDEDNSKRMSEERRSAVANAVQEMLQVAERVGGIGEQVREVAQNQIKTHEELELELEALESRSNFIKFLIGPKYNQIKVTQKLLEQNREQVQQLSEIKAQLKAESDQKVLDEQIQLLERANIEIEGSIESSQKGFSLLGWMMKIFSK